LRHSDWWFSLMVVAVLVAYLPAWNGKPLWDDDAHMTKPELRSLSGLMHIWTDPRATQQYYPLVHSVFWVEHRLWGEWTLPYHLVNIVLHAFSAWLLLRILRQLEVPGGWLAAGIFALHPVQVESVAWISELKNTLSGVFYLGSALAYLRFDRSRRWKDYRLALGLFVLGLMCKTVIASLSAALLVVWWWKRGRLRWKEDVLPQVPWLALGMAAGLFTAWVERNLVGAQGKAFDLSLIERLLIAGRAFWFYLGKLFWPVDLMFNYPRWIISQGAGWQYLFPGAALLLVAGLWVVARRHRGPLAAVLFFGGTLFPALGFLNVYPFRFSFVADHFQYLASVGVISLASAGVALWLGRWRLWGRAGGNAVCLVVLAVLGCLTWRQSQMYTDLETLWRTTLKSNPDAWQAHDNLASALLQQGQVDQAIAHFQKSVQIWPQDVLAHNGLGVALVRGGRVDEAISEFGKAAELEPTDASARINLANLLFQKGQLDEAITQYQKVLNLEPNNAYAFGKIGSALLRKGQVDEAVAYFRKSVEIEPHNPETQNRLGDLLLRAGHGDEAIGHYQMVLNIEPGNVDAEANLGNALRLKGQLDEAIAHYQKALAIQPHNANLQANLGNALLRQGRWAEALAHLRQTVEIEPNNAYFLNDLARVLATSPEASLRDGTQAVALAQRADGLAGGGNPGITATLAAAYAESGQFPEAIAAAQRALDLAARQNNIPLVNFLQRQIELYRAGSTFRDTGAAKSTVPRSPP
jgi:tetratricopeptide (TPR) repeat protein